MAVSSTPEGHSNQPSSLTDASESSPNTSVTIPEATPLDFTPGATSDSPALAGTDSAPAAAQPEPQPTATPPSPSDHPIDDTITGHDGMWRIEFQKLAKPTQFDVGIGMRSLLPLFHTGAESNATFHIHSKDAKDTIKTVDEFPDTWEDFIKFFHCKRDNGCKKHIVAF